MEWHAMRVWAVRLTALLLLGLVGMYALPGDMDFWRTAGLLSAAVGQTAFVLLYATFPWWKKFMGRALFFKALALGVLADVAVIGRVWDWPYEEQTFIVLYWMLAIGVWFQFFAFAWVRVHRRQDSVSGNGDLR